MSMPEMIARAASRASDLVTEIGSLDLDAPTTCADFDQRAQEQELSYLASSENAQRALAEQYVGLPYE